ncbi:bifunctional diaminohydroxyphosphoribosylaminopyrimidine deaminase/5-amino-6-(5-phosphoribosylamino)uracil reductase RibD [Motilimonas sp. E26]|uniref:bifunctional diaminohydroxyphosphoribosylaminopyrimidine deaminase/5-amino-6-(5-phosphoribosylamino)uracil reductase RibD n=1 Tax=Motilimonas sp. E26 TaxID=2865674 RepID=UPI001E553F49|nr:bifunctional diaminohydroxyphosphoribosylaminopyrimidine deaminase/5-amino-6-(5-phosphoribosylamino)uracil reductase RibD [Motilimonas sp. E26]
MKKSPSWKNNTLSDTSNQTLERRLMAQAIELAATGIYTTAPAANFAGVFTFAGNVVASSARKTSIEPCAICRQAQALLRSEQDCDTVYLTSEPSHELAQILVTLGIKQLQLACLLEPEQTEWRNVCEQGNIAVAIGLLESEAKALNHDLWFRRQHGRPFVRLKLAASLDGRTALKNGQSKWITSSEARADVQLFRAKSDVILSGSGTVVADNPSLNVRWSELTPLHSIISQDQLRQPARVIIDNRQQLDQHYQLFGLPGDTFLVASSEHKNTQAKTLVIAEQNGHVCLSQLMLKLATLSFNSVWVEAGQTLAGALLAENLVDEFILYQAPKLMGSSSRGLVDLPEYTQMSQVPELSLKQVDLIGPDLRLICVPKQ